MFAVHSTRLILAVMFLSIVGVGYSATVTKASIDTAIECLAGVIVDVLIEA